MLGNGGKLPFGGTFTLGIYYSSGTFVTEITGRRGARCTGGITRNRVQLHNRLKRSSKKPTSRYRVWCRI
jgi:hypothetical protein